MSPAFLKRLLITALILMLAACAANDTFREGQRMIDGGDLEEGLARVEQALKARPNDVEMRNYYLRNRPWRCSATSPLGDNARAVGAHRRSAQAAYRARAALRSGEPRAKAGLEAVAERPRRAAADGRSRRGAEGAATTRPPTRKAKQVLADESVSSAKRARIARKVEEQGRQGRQASPQLTAALKKPITIELRDAPVRAVFELISKRSRPQLRLRPGRAGRRCAPRCSCSDTPIEEVMRFVLVTNQLERRCSTRTPCSSIRTRRRRRRTTRSWWCAASTSPTPT